MGRSILITTQQYPHDSHTPFSFLDHPVVSQSESSMFLLPSHLPFARCLCSIPIHSSSIIAVRLDRVRIVHPHSVGKQPPLSQHNTTQLHSPYQPRNQTAKILQPLLHCGSNGKGHRSVFASLLFSLVSSSGWNPGRKAKRQGHLRRKSLKIKIP